MFKNRPFVPIYIQWLWVVRTSSDDLQRFAHPTPRKDSMVSIQRSMVLAVLALALCAQAQTPKGNSAGGCLVANFKALALKTHNPDDRAQLAEAWLFRYAAVCSNEQLAMIRANSPSWLGTGLTQELSSLLEGAIEAKISGNPALMSKLYESAGKEGSASIETFKIPTPRAPVVQPSVNNGILSGSANYGNISGPSTVNQNNVQTTQQNAGAGSQQTAIPVNNAQVLNPGNTLPGRR